MGLISALLSRTRMKGVAPARLGDRKMRDNV